MIAFAVDIRIRVHQFVVLGLKPILPSGDLQLLIAESPLAVLGFPGRFFILQMKLSAVVFPTA